MNKTVFAVALNHKSQMEHWHDTFLQDPYKKLPVKPVWFIKPRNTYNDNHGIVPLDPNETYFSGGTLAIVIGKEACKIKADDYRDYIAGFALANEISLEESSFYRPAIKAKCQDGSCPVASVGQSKDIKGLDIETYINDKLVQTINTDDFILCPGRILEELTEFVTLQEGDMVLIGTPQERIALASGDKIEIKASGFETLVNFAK